MSRLAVATVGAVEDEIVRKVIEIVSTEFGLPAERSASLPEPDYAWDSQRRQHGSTPILEVLQGAFQLKEGKVLALTEKDLFIPMLSFVYGQAQVYGPLAIVSLARLRQEFYGLPANRELLMTRLRKEALHELGHTFGLVHCADKSCVMALATNIQALDRKAPRFCSGCRALLEERISPVEMEKRV